MIEKENVKLNESLKLHTTYKVGGICKYFITPKDLEELIELVKYLREKNIKYMILGNGSNTIFSSKEYDGVIINLTNLNSMKIEGNKIDVEAGYQLIKLSMDALNNSLSGLEFAAGIPGNVGGAVFMNAGAYKSDMGYVVEKVKILTPHNGIISLSNKEMDFHYRSSYLQRHRDYVCLEVVIRLVKGKREAIEEVIRDRKQRRVDTQPLEYPSAGSVFRNPEGMFAGQLIEELGLKGETYGGAMISDKHANFVINNTRNAKASDIKYLIDLAHDKVLEKYKVDMKIEQEFVNFK